MRKFDLIKPYFHANRFDIAAGLLCLIAVDILQLFIPRILKLAVDDLTAFRASDQDLLQYAGLIVGIALAMGLLRYGWRLRLMGLSRRVEEGLRNRLFAHIQGLSPSYFDKTAAGDLMAHASNDIQNVRMATGMGLVALTDAVVLGTAAVGFMAYIHVGLTLFVLIPMPLIVFSTKFFSKRMHRLYQEVQGVFSEMTETVRERFAGIRIVKAYLLESKNAEDVANVSRRYVRVNLALARLIQSFFPMMLFFANLSLVLVLYLGGRQTIRFAITPGDFVAFISYLGLLTWPMMALGWVTNLIQRGGASLDRIKKIMNTLPEVPPVEPGKTKTPNRWDLCFQDVAFSYDSPTDAERPWPAVAEINLKIPQGSTLGIVGPPGAGKTTLISLIPRLYDVFGGMITLGGVNIRHMELDRLRACMAFMPQEAFLFADTIEFNITLKRPGVTEKHLRDVLHRAALDDTIQGFPDGLKTLAGEKGLVLSGGQKQRVALARTLLSDAPILILDDPISQVDTVTAHRIIRELYSVTREKTLILVSHRISAVRPADRIIVMDQGRIVDSGTHAQLLSTSDYYRRTHQLQSIEEEFDAR
ncbi:MAG: ABC transporter ATP-binding protein [Deltaproteobacteria bacterium]|nr:ABC transporter ATP-binding protein [Deltaproteobacteria bacterium]